MSQRQLNERGIKAKQEALAMLTEHLDELMQRVSTDPTSKSFGNLFDLQLFVPPGELLTVVLDAIDDRISEIKSEWNEGDWHMWSAVAVGVLDEDRSQG